MGGVHEENKDNTICEHTWCICTDCPRYGEAGNNSSCKVKIRDTVLHRAELERGSRAELDISERYGYVYITENLINHRLYIGKRSSSVFDTGYHGSGKLIRQAIRKYGIENFETEVLEWCKEPVILNERESYWIKEYDATNGILFYNISSGSDHKELCKKVVCIETGKVFNSVEEANMSISSGRVHDAIGVRTFSSCGYIKSAGGFHWAFEEDYTKNGRNFYLDEIEKFNNRDRGKALRGRRHSEEEKLNISRALKRREELARIDRSINLGFRWKKGMEPVNKGKKLSLEERRKISEGMKNSGHRIVNRKRIKCIELNRTFISLREAIIEMGIPDNRDIKIPAIEYDSGNKEANYKGYHWSFKEAD